MSEARKKHRQGPLCWFVTLQKLQQQGHFEVVAPFSTVWDLVADYLEPTLNLSGWTEVLEARLVTDTLSHVFFFLSFSPEPAQCVVRVLIPTETHASCCAKCSNKRSFTALSSRTPIHSITVCLHSVALEERTKESISLCVCVKSQKSLPRPRTHPLMWRRQKIFFPSGSSDCPSQPAVFPLALLVVAFPRVTDCQRYSSDVQLVLRAYAAHASTHTCARTHRNCCCIIQGQIEGC